MLDQFHATSRELAQYPGQVHVTAETLLKFDSEGCSHLHDGPNLAPHTVRRLSCDTGIVRIIEDPEGMPPMACSARAVTSKLATSMFQRIELRICRPSA